MQLKFHLEVNQYHYNFNNFKTSNDREINQILFSQHSLALDMVPSKEVISLKTLKSVRLKAILQKHKLVKVVLDFG